MFSPLGLRQLRAVGQPTSSPTFARSRRLVAPLFACLAVSACDPPESEPPASIVITDDNNYSATSVLTLGDPVVTVAGEDVEICFDAVDEDLQCHGVDPLEDIKNVSLTAFDDLDVSEIEEMLGKGNLEISDVAAYYEVNTDGEESCVSLEAMVFGEGDIDLGETYVESEDRKYILVFSSTTEIGQGALTMLLVEPRADSENAAVAAAPGCGKLEFEASIADKDPISVPEDGDELVIGWKDVETDGIGNEFAPLKVSSLLLAYYEDATPANLEENFFDLELDATEIWEMPIPQGGKSADLKDTVHREDDENFDGFAGYGEGTWIVALMCATCQNPAPLVLSVLEPE